MPFRLTTLARAMAVACAVACLAWSAAADERFRCNRDIRPILSENCFGCHGPDDHDRKAGLRLDVPQPHTPPTDSGHAAIVQGKPEESELSARILSNDPDLVMSPPESNKSLTAAQSRRRCGAGSRRARPTSPTGPVSPRCGPPCPR